MVGGARGGQWFAELMASRIFSTRPYAEPTEVATREVAVTASRRILVPQFAAIRWRFPFVVVRHGDDLAVVGPSGELVLTLEERLLLRSHWGSI